MRNYFSNLSREIVGYIRIVADECDRKDVAAYLIGGIVRDLILKKKNLDLDILIEKNAIAVAKFFAKEIKGELKLYPQFKTATVICPNNLKIDFSTARKESYSKPGALPTVSNGLLKEDLYRRDFTMNAMAICINRAQFGVLVDEFGGLKDLKAKKIRVLHKKSFIDDPTRILRAIRFEQRLGFRVEPATLLLLKAAVKGRFYKTVKADRYFAEFRKNLMEDRPVLALRRLRVLKCLDFLDKKINIDLPFIEQLSRKLPHLKRRKVYSEFEDWWFVLFLGILAKHDAPFHAKITDQFAFTKGYKKDILCLSQWKDVLKMVSGNGISRSEVYKALKDFSFSFLIFLRSISEKKEIEKRIDLYVLEDYSKKLLINGNDLKKKGKISGNRIGEILDEVLGQKLDGLVKDKRDELKAAYVLLEQQS